MSETPSPAFGDPPHAAPGNDEAVTVTDRATARIVGVLYIVGTVAGVLSVVVTSGPLAGSDYLTKVASHAAQVRSGALLVLIMGVSLAMVPALMFPILKRQNQALAVGYVIFRGALETLTYIVVALNLMLLVLVGQQYARSEGAVASGWDRLGGLLVKVQDGPVLAVQDIVFSIGALMFYYLLYRGALVPRWLSGWGIVGAAGYLTAGVVVVFGPHLVALLMPLALQEMVLAIWLIAKGFHAGTIGSTPDRREPDRAPVVA
jgi:hypothetical protein